MLSSLTFAPRRPGLLITGSHIELHKHGTRTTHGDLPLSVCASTGCGSAGRASISIGCACVRICTSEISVAIPATVFRVIIPAPQRSHSRCAQVGAAASHAARRSIASRQMTRPRRSRRGRSCRGASVQWSKARSLREQLVQGRGGHTARC